MDKITKWIVDNIKDFGKMDKDNMIKQPNPPDITRVEIINHADNKYEKGRLQGYFKRYGDFKKVELEFQDEGKTLKIFLS